MKIMSTYSGLHEPNRERREAKRTLNDKSTVSFALMEPFANHFDYRHAVDDHNALRHMRCEVDGIFVVSATICITRSSVRKVRPTVTINFLY